MYCYFTSCFVCEHSRLMITKPNSKIGSGRSHVFQMTFLARSQIIFFEPQESLEWMMYFLSVWKLRNDLDSTKKFLHGLHLFLSHLKQPLFWCIVCPSSTVLKRDGANNSNDRRKDGMIELWGKSSFSLGLDSGMDKYMMTSKWPVNLNAGG